MEPSNSCKIGHAVVLQQEISHDEPPKMCRDCVYRLTERQREVLRLLANGFSTNEIAEKLSVCTATVETHRQAISRVLGTRSVALQTRYAIKKGLIEIGG